jgi:hypothetical protein
VQWISVFAALDGDDFYVPDDLGFEALLALWAMLVARAPFPIELFVNSVWRNVRGQVSFLRYAVWTVRATTRCACWCNHDFCKMWSSVSVFAILQRMLCMTLS